MHFVTAECGHVLPPSFYGGVTVTDDGSKLLLLKNIAKRLKPGATLVLADLHGEGEFDSFTQLFSAWKSFYFNRLGNTSIEDENNFEKAINSIYFVSETII